ncbi:MAG: hypothetical protein HY611_02930, partial [Elusimicrobia bacterium]|nr:hypothetical protein [Elusimicrobiota bacterium]
AKQQKENIDFKGEIQNRGPDGLRENRKFAFSIGTEDIIAIFAGLIAVFFAIAMGTRLLPINKLTIGLASFSGLGAVLAEVIKAKSKKK